MPSTRVLCVENSPAYRHTLKSKLEAAGYEVISAASGEEAVILLSEQKVAGVLLEEDLPGENGAAVREEMKHKKPDVPVLLFSGVGRQTSMLLRFVDAYLRNEGSRE